MWATRSATGVGAAIRLRAVWLVLLALTTLAAMVSLFTFSFVAQEGECVHALRSGEITSVAVGHSQEFHSDIGFSSSADHASEDIAASWVNGFGLRREAILGELMALDQAHGADDGGAGPSSSSVDPSASIAAKARSLGVVAPKMVQPGELPLGGIAWLPPGVAVLMIMLIAVVHVSMSPAQVGSTRAIGLGL